MQRDSAYETRLAVRRKGHVNHSRYRFSGSWSRRGLTHGALGGALSIPLGAGYGCLSSLPWPGVFAAALALALGSAVGFLVAQPMVLGKLRNPALAATVAALFATLAHAVGWIVWLRLIVLRQEAGFPFAQFLRHMPSLLIEINRRGSWSFAGSEAPVHGLALWLTWSIEALAVVMSAALTAAWIVFKVPYCESCGRWCQKQRGALFRSGTVEVARAALRRDDWVSTLAALPLARSTDPSWLQLDLFHCPRCQQVIALTLRTLTRVRLGHRVTTIFQRVSPPANLVHTLGTLVADRCWEKPTPPRVNARSSPSVAPP